MSDESEHEIGDRDWSVLQAEPPALVDKSLRFVRLFYGTNRDRIEPCTHEVEVRWQGRGKCQPSNFFGGFLSKGSGGKGEGLEVGTLTVTFPPGHAVGKIERPLQIFTVSFRSEDPEIDVVISELSSFGSDHEAWVRELKMTGRDQAFIYVHGFQTTFDQAARRAAQLAYDLDFDLEKDFRGVPMFFSWPSRGGVDAYGVDYDVSLESIDAFNLFLDLVKERAGVRRVHIIAHSMGNRVVTEALYARAHTNPQLVDQLILAAPDVWASRFKSRFLHTLPRLASRVTLYVSDHDQALLTSSSIRKQEPRAGEVAGGLLEASRGVERFDAINASTLQSDFLGHSYYANHGSMLGDIYCLLKGFPANARPLLVLASAGWQFRSPAEMVKLQAGACRPEEKVSPNPEPEPITFPWPLAGASFLGAALLCAAVLWMSRWRARS